MTNIHNPQRQPGETQKEYRERMAKSRSVRHYVRKVDLRELGNKPPSIRDWHRARAKTERPAAPEPKFAETRKRKQHAHPLHDAHGAYTCVGPVYEVYGLKPTSREHVISGGQDANGEPFYTARRKWLGGVSAQRGF